MAKKAKGKRDEAWIKNTAIWIREQEIRIKEVRIQAKAARESAECLLEIAHLNDVESPRQIVIVKRWGSDP